MELTLEDLIILLVEETVFSDSKFEIFLLEPVCCVQLNRGGGLIDLVENPQ